MEKAFEGQEERKSEARRRRGRCGFSGLPGNRNLERSAASLVLVYHSHTVSQPRSSNHIWSYFQANDFLAELPFDVECVSPSEVASADFLLLQGCDVLGNGSGQEKLMSFHDNGDLKRPENVPLKT